MTIRCFVLGLTFLGLAVGAGAQPPSAREQITQRIEDIRRAITVKNAEGIIAWGTPDWQFTDQEGKHFDRSAYLVRVQALFDRIVIFESLQTTVDALEAGGDQALVAITQTAVRREKDPSTGAVHRWKIRYHERQEWVLGADGWRVRRVSFEGAIERHELPLEPVK